MQNEPQLELLRFPAGRFVPNQPLSEAERQSLIEAICAFPATLQAAVARLSPAQLEMPYRPGGWTARQVIHHLADSHTNAFIRFKLALTEENPTIKPYDQDGFAALPDNELPIAVSMQLLEAVHQRWGAILRAMTAAQWARTFVHPEKDSPQALSETLRLYDWHSRHHLGHINIVAEMR